MALSDYDRLDAVGLSALVARREVTAAEALEAAIARADARNPRLNAIVTRDDAGARARARGPLPPGPLSGVPFLFKDLHAAWKGHGLTGSSRLRAGHVSDHDAVVTQRALAAGLVPFGQTSTPELGILAVTEPALRGPTRNPWNPAHTPGGSSGGAGAAVSARIVPAAHGTDHGGSIRIPASACGVLGLKPTRGRVPFAPDPAGIWDGWDTQGVVCRSVRDAAAFLDALAGPAPGDPFQAPPPQRAWRDEVGAPPGRLRVAFTAGPIFGRTVHPECKAAVEAAARLLAELGHEVVEARPAFSRDALASAYLTLLAAGTAADVAEAEVAVGRRARGDDLEPETWALVVGGRVLRARDVALATREVHRAARALALFHEAHDLFLTPTLAAPPVRIGQLALLPHERLGLKVFAAVPTRAMLDVLFQQIADKTFDVTGNTMLFNQTGQPAASVPLHWTPEGLPVGVQVVARHGDEATLLRVAAQLEAARPWADRVPPSLEAPGR
jgi:amidase